MWYYLSWSGSNGMFQSVAECSISTGVGCSNFNPWRSELNVLMSYTNISTGVDCSNFLFLKSELDVLMSVTSTPVSALSSVEFSMFPLLWLSETGNLMR